MPIKVGDKLPNATIRVMTAEGPNPKTCPIRKHHPASAVERSSSRRQNIPRTGPTENSPRLMRLQASPWVRAST